MIRAIIPVYNRPQEAEEILASLARQSFRNFAVVVVEDGSSVDCRAVAEGFRDALNLAYLVKPNGGPASARNFGVREGCDRCDDFLVFLDSDCILPERYMETVRRAVEGGTEFFGGADMASRDFSPMQRAVSYSMTSLFTTGGIRGGRRGGFIPRSFNMGVTRRLFDAVGGFSDMRFGEDIDFSMKVLQTGAEAVLLDGAEVCHKRRTDMRSFFRQVFHSGIARINLSLRHPGSLKPLHILPAFFLAGSLACLAAAA
ncbi:MAG: glycosyltransferase, partial [Rikenellaceae bacterium]|nr:glycosyltransferase [Rikenellaceae bacterium]